MRFGPIREGDVPEPTLGKNPACVPVGAVRDSEPHVIITFYRSAFRMHRTMRSFDQNLKEEERKKRILALLGFGATEAAFIPANVRRCSAPVTGVRF
jgi:hypothetical protein